MAGGVYGSEDQAGSLQVIFAAGGEYVRAVRNTPGACARMGSHRGIHGRTVGGRLCFDGSADLAAIDAAGRHYGVADGAGSAAGAGDSPYARTSGSADSRHSVANAYTDFGPPAAVPHHCGSVARSGAAVRSDRGSRDLARHEWDSKPFGLGTACTTQPTANANSTFDAEAGRD